MLMRITTALMLIVALAALVPTTASAVAASYNAGRCYCTEDQSDTSTGEAPDGQFKNTDSISMDTAGTGNTSDWQSIINDPDQIVCDDSTGNDEDGDGFVDRDTVVQSTGRDLQGFSFGWDSNPTSSSYVKFFTARYASTSNVQAFAYYGDVDGDNLLTSADIVIGVTWKGSNRTVFVGLYQYTPVNAGGDCLHETVSTGGVCDGLGFVDGYDMPGSLSFLACSSHPTFNNSKCEAKTGEGGGVQMEFATTWADLLQNSTGISPGFPIIFHVSSNNASLTAASWAAQIDDNLGGCGGKWGSSQFGAGNCTAQGDTDATNANGTVEIAHINMTPDGTETIELLIDNDSNGPDTFDLAVAIATDWVVNDSGATSTDAPTWELFLDDGDGVFEPAGDDAPALSAPLETNQLDEDGGTDEFDTLWVRYSMPNPTNAVYDPSGTAEVTVTITSQAKSAFSAACDANFIVAAPQPDFSLSKTAIVWSDPLGQGTYEIPGSVMEYQVVISNNGGGQHAQNALWVSDEFPVGVEFAVGNLTCADHTDGPVCLSDGGESSGLLFTAVNAMYDPDISDTTDYIDFSSVANPDPRTDADWVYTPTDPDLDGYDPAVTAFRIRPPAASSDQMNATTSTTVGNGAPSNPSFTVTFRVRVQ
jgi:hypothetical protein